MTIEHQSPNATGPEKRSSTLVIVLAWVVVAVPALWGISMSARTAMQLFQPQATPAVQTK